MDLCLHELIEEQAQRTPNKPALVFEQESMTYRELDRRANQVAHRLRNLGVGPDTLVGLHVERSLKMIVGLLGILKTGGAYVPIDTAFPRDRIAFMLSDADVRILLTTTNLVKLLPQDAAHFLCLDSLDWGRLQEVARSEVRVHPDNLAYVIYTSGSTGRPKGVCIEHRNIVNYVLGVTERLQLKPDMNYATVSTIAADLGHTVIFPALTTGGCLHVIAQERVESQAMLAEYFERERIDVLKIVPSHLAALQAGRTPERVMPKRRLILGGEASRLDWIERLRTLAPGCEIFNHYGPTETTVGVLTYHVGEQLPETRSGTLPLGTPVANCRIHILDEQGQPVPMGERGELYVGGDGVARGYLNRPELTAEKFVPDRFDSDPRSRLYRTGDLARYLSDGNVEFCGRIDDQVKIRGYRIEPGEIEQALRSHPGVRDAVVVANQDASGLGQLVACLVPKRAHQPLWETKAVHVLPDGTPVAHLNRNETEYIYKEIFILQAYLRHGIEIHDGDCIVDVGANVGLFSVFAGRLARDLRVISFEPNPDAFECLKVNAEVWCSGATCLPFGLSSEDKSADLTVFQGLSLLSGFYADAATERDVVMRYALNLRGAESSNDPQLSVELGELVDSRLKSRTVSARLRTLSSVIRELGIDRIDLLKINVEKSEWDVLEGVTSGDWSKIRQLVIEVDLDDTLEPIIALLKQQGFETLVEQDPLLRKTALRYVYAIRPSSVSRLISQQPADAHIRALRPGGEEILTPATLRKYLKERLAPYMIPSVFGRMESFPLTSNGKVDRQRLSSSFFAGSDSHQASSAPGAEQVGSTDFGAPRGDVETRLAGIWEAVLGVKPIGRRDNFFEIGGHSLIAVRLVSEIEKALGRRLPLATLFEAPTVEQLAALLENKTPSHASSPLVTIQAAGNRPALFCVHGHVGEVLFYQPLSQRLGSDQPFYALQSIAREGRPAHDTVEAMAEDYVNAMRSVQPHGPYRIGGYCFGALVAFEMAQQVKAQSEEVAFLGLLVGDTSSVSSWERAKRHLLQFREAGAKAKTADLLRRTAAKYRTLLWRAKYKMFRSHLPDSSPLFRNLPEMNGQAMKRYVAKQYHGRMTIFLSGVTDWVSFRSQLNQLDADCIGVCRVPGDRDTMMHEPFVGHLAEHLRSYLCSQEEQPQASIATFASVSELGAAR